MIGTDVRTDQVETITARVAEKYGRGRFRLVAHGLWPSTEAAEAALAAMSPLGMTSEPEDTAHAFVYLASEEARFVTGACLFHDGGIGGIY